MDDTAGPIMVFDGVCVFCSSGARLVRRHDRRGVVRFAHAQSGLGGRLYRHYGWDPDRFETNLLLWDGRVHSKWATLAAMGRIMGGPWGLLRCCALVPDIIGDRVYDFIARNRYRVFGRTANCAIPDAAMKSRMIDMG
ncbi:thiol-disulfide oxidoreductase DCC family protein [Zhengella mangrovi]|uniref:thiol-disulfide oxidoreductase DCC family protein n=1 Tax=Zhengella mangrovi TaxID=1982044 RepID=UPI0013FDF142|nr:DCC1-like thiol-disulfide oxidoreductase family protein [Zhengella mangrovi]